MSASTSPASCAACHTSAQCLDCHRPSAAATGVYHTADFLSRHPSAAWARETSCSDCHNVGSFCVDCHRQSGLTAQTQLRAGYHDGQRLFTVGHGQAARQGLETCVSCHTERDCLRCHSATAGPQFNPHGPGFDAQRLRQKNLAVCTVCHGTSIPDP